MNSYGFGNKPWQLHFKQIEFLRPASCIEISLTGEAVFFFLFEKEEQIRMSNDA